MQNLLPDVPPTLLPENEPAAAALEKALATPEDVAALKAVAADYPTYSAAWGRLAEWVKWGQIKPGVDLVVGEPLFPRYQPPKA